MYELCVLLIITFFEIMLFFFGSKYIIKDQAKKNIMPEDNLREEKDRVLYFSGAERPGL